MNEHDTIRDLLDWFEQEGRDWPWRRTRDRWVILVSELCLQQTQVERAAGHIERILVRFPTAPDLARAELPELLDLWQGLGYPRRARNLWLAAQLISAEGWPADYQQLPGVGPYTAAALSCFADELPVLPPDINTRRVMQRLFPNGAPDPASHPALHERSWAWGQAVMELGQTSCKARAQCTQCVMAPRCPSVGTTATIASARQAPYKGSMRERRGNLLRRLQAAGKIAVAHDPAAAHSLDADGLAQISRDSEWLLPAGTAGRG